MNSSEINVYNTRDITWTRNQFHESVHEVEVTVTGNNSDFFGAGTVSLNVRILGDTKSKFNSLLSIFPEQQLKCFASVDHGEDFPHLLHSENSTEFDLVLDGLRVNSSFPNARFAAEFIIVSEEFKYEGQSFTVHSKKSLDDEHTPGIFEIVEIASPKSFVGNEGKACFSFC